MSNDFDKYLAIANHDIQMANNDGQLKSYVASILYDYDKNVEQLLLDKCKAELELVRLNNIINELEKYINEAIGIERLNNIINELEKALLEWHEYWKDNDYYSFQYKNAYDYLQMLKGSDEE